MRSAALRFFHQPLMGCTATIRTGEIGPRALPQILVKGTEVALILADEPRFDSFARAGPGLLRFGGPVDATHELIDAFGRGSAQIAGHARRRRICVASPGAKRSAR